MTKIIFKENCRFKEYSAPLHWIFTCLRELVMHASDELPGVIVITSVNDSTHMEGSKHYSDEAIDIRSKNFRTHEAKVDFVLMLKSMLNSNHREPNSFTVILEAIGTDNEHIHAQVRRGEQFNGV